MMNCRKEKNDKTAPFMRDTQKEFLYYKRKLCKEELTPLQFLSFDCPCCCCGANSAPLLLQREPENIIDLCWKRTQGFYYLFGSGRPSSSWSLKALLCLHHRVLVKKKRWPLASFCWCISSHPSVHPGWLRVAITAAQEISWASWLSCQT